MTKNAEITVDIDVARKMLHIAGYKFVSEMTDNEIFEKAAMMNEQYGVKTNFLEDDIMKNIDILRKQDLLTLCKLERSILLTGPIRADDNGFDSEEDQIRLKEFYELQKKYSYGWYISQDSLDGQIKAINDFKKYIIDNL